VPEPTETEPAGPPPTPGLRPEHPALTAFRQRTRRANRIWAAVLAAAVVVAFVAVRLAYAHGEITKVSRASAPAVSAVPGSSPAQQLSPAWHTDDAAATGTPYQDGIVVTYHQHTVNGRDARTGQVRWHYTRSDETLCSVLQQDSSTIAIYRRKGNCDEVTGFVTATGVPKFYRTLTDDGSTAAASFPNVVMTVGTHFVHEFDNAGGLDRWDWTAPDGCAVSRALAGNLGTLISLDCGSKHQLVLRDLIQDSTKWTVDTPAAMVPLTSSAALTALDPATGALYRYGVTKGDAVAAGQVSGAPATGYPAAAASLVATNAQQQPIEFSFAGKLLAISADGTVQWTAAASAAPSAVTAAFVAVPVAPGAVVLHRVDRGQTQLTVTASPPPADDAGPVYPVGAGLLFTGPGAGLYR